MSPFHALFKSKFEAFFFILLLLSGIHWIAFQDYVFSGLILFAGAAFMLIAAIGNRVIKMSCQKTAKGKIKEEREKETRENVAQ